MRRAIASAIVLFAACIWPATAADLVLVDARIHPLPETAPIERGTVRVRDRRIVATGPLASVVVPAGAMVLDGNGRFDTAGCWNSHAHFLTPSASGVDIVWSAR